MPRAHLITPDRGSRSRSVRMQGAEPRWPFLLVAVCLLGPLRAHAQAPPVARLSFDRAGGAEPCVDEEELRERVAARLGRDPFVEEAPLAIDVRISPADASGFVAMIALTDARDARETHREITSSRADCADLGDALALAVSLAVDPTSLLRPAGAESVEAAEPSASDEATTSGSPAAPEPEPEPEPQPAEAPASEETAREFHDERSSPISLRIGAMLFGSYGVAPNASAGLALSLGARYRDVSLDLELRAEVPTEIDGDNGTVRGAPFTAALVPCGHVDAVALCGVLRAGAFYGEGVDAVASRSALSAYTAIGVRGGAEIPIGPSVDLRVLGEATTPVTSVELRLGPEVVWDTPPVALSIGVGLGGRLE